MNHIQHSTYEYEYCTFFLIPRTDMATAESVAWGHGDIQQFKGSSSHRSRGSLIVVMRGSEILITLWEPLTFAQSGGHVAA